MSSRGIIAEESPQRCEICGIIDECRPYGPENEKICYECGMKDPVTTERQMLSYIFGTNNE